MKNICLDGQNKQVAPLELNIVFVFNATNSRLRRSRRETNRSRGGNNAICDQKVEELNLWCRYLRYRERFVQI